MSSNEERLATIEAVCQHMSKQIDSLVDQDLNVRITRNETYWKVTIGAIMIMVPTLAVAIGYFL